MAKNNKPGRGVRSMRIEDRIKEAASDLHEVCDGVVIVCVKFSGTHDNDEQVVRSTRGSHLAVYKAIDMLNDYDDSGIEIITLDEDESGDAL